MSEEANQPADAPSARGLIRNPQDFVGGLVLVALALVALWASSELQGRRGFAFGAGTAPWLFAGLLAANGALVAIMGLVYAGPATERYAWRGPLYITASVLTFAATIRPLGLVISSFMTMLVCAAAAPDVRWRESIILSAVLTVFCSVLFPSVLNLPMQLWPPRVAEFMAIFHLR